MGKPRSPGLRAARKLPREPGLSLLAPLGQLPQSTISLLGILSRIQPLARHHFRLASGMIPGNRLPERAI